MYKDVRGHLATFAVFRGKFDVQVLVQYQFSFLTYTNADPGKSIFFREIPIHNHHPQN